MFDKNKYIELRRWLLYYEVIWDESIEVRIRFLSIYAISKVRLYSGAGSMSFDRLCRLNRLYVKRSCSFLGLHTFFDCWVSLYTLCIPFSFNTLFLTYQKKIIWVREIDGRKTYKRKVKIVGISLVLITILWILCGIFYISIKSLLWLVFVTVWQIRLCCFPM